MPFTEAARAEFLARSRDKIIEAGNKAFLIGYDVGCMHVAHASTTTPARRDVDCEEGAEQISILFADVFAEIIIEGMPRR